MENTDVKLASPSPGSAESMRVHAERAALAKELRDNHPGKWAVISEGHSSINSAGMVRRRLAKRPEWLGFEMVSQLDPETGTCQIFARYTGGELDLAVAQQMALAATEQARERLAAAAGGPAPAGVREAAGDPTEGRE